MPSRSKVISSTSHTLSLTSSCSRIMRGATMRSPCNPVSPTSSSGPSRDQCTPSGDVHTTTSGASRWPRTANMIHPKCPQSRSVWSRQSGTTQGERNQRPPLISPKISPTRRTCGSKAVGSSFTFSTVAAISGTSAK